MIRNARPLCRYYTPRVTIPRQWAVVIKIRFKSNYRRFLNGRPRPVLSNWRLSKLENSTISTITNPWTPLVRWNVRGSLREIWFANKRHIAGSHPAILANNARSLPFTNSTRGAAQSPRNIYIFSGRTVGISFWLIRAVMRRVTFH